MSCYILVETLATLVSGGGGGELPGFCCAPSGNKDFDHLSCVRRRRSRWVDLILDVHSSVDTDCGLSCFRILKRWVGLVFHVHSSSDTDYALSGFRRPWLVLFQLKERVSHSTFTLHFIGDTVCGLCCFRIFW
ncbi:uncharacterized protein LACBIDRAFT_317704 [Laccaria bicolor S238N-H82]|uniref:Predicted protein n=1 Tax=Laccaria bicolor (strain S238N-H82 / ATCC MYA-4686) TaxID=486041 RepID=B0E281_LACBS|nr:uncharacterized protein LACBIDRAFT_317704 [Laccaria bicolor S238N-H82]EDQ99050.1 predicted protein [Laccaria bicolor S238N-H82]|eukprot:XP_001890293.1 predicted protein [Laccaria bicolor S238N-H82]